MTAVWILWGQVQWWTCPRGFHDHVTLTTKVEKTEALPFLMHLRFLKKKYIFFKVFLSCEPYQCHR